MEQTTLSDKHTPGPWVLSTALSPKGAPIIFSPNAHSVICALHYPRGNNNDDYGAFENIEANARLIAAAPDMLKELERSNSEFKELQNYIKTWSPDDIRLTGIQMQIEWNEAAIAKARGVQS